MSPGVHTTVMPSGLERRRLIAPDMRALTAGTGMPEKASKTTEELRRRNKAAAAKPPPPDDLHHLVRRCLYRFTAILPSDLAKVLWRVDLSGQSIDDAADRLGLQPAECESRLRRARRAFGRHFESLAKRK